MSFTDMKRHIFSENDASAHWHGRKGGLLWCCLCDYRFSIGDGFRWVYANVPSSKVSFGNFFVCDECDGEDVIERYFDACQAILESVRDRGEDCWPVGAVAKLQKELKQRG